MADIPTNKDNISDEENGSTLKDKKAKAMMYVQQIKHLPITDLMNQSKENQLETLKRFAEQAKAVRYALIIHDKDLDENGIPKEPHVHLMLEFEQSIRLSTVASRLNDKPNYLETYSRKGTKSDIQNGFAYLIHFTNNAKDKFQYDIEEVRANFDFKAYIESLESGISISSLLNTLREGKITALKAKQVIATQAGAITFAKFEPKIMKIEELRQEEEFQRWQTKMIADNISKKIFWLFGNSGVGKSLIASIIADNKKIDKLVDSFGQLNRRLSLILEITKDDLIELDYDEKYGSYIQKNFRKNVYLRDTITNTITLDDVLKNLDN
ncbi:Rep family protein [Lysinibacillus fusiformis]|uniref:Rep family protein n=1 Tax=Lysinibacillus fusiformis TaxID=28031 RepID=UPI0035584E50